MTLMDQANEIHETIELGDLADGLDPYACAACLTVGDACEFHRGFGEGWDACVALFARMVDHERTVELVGDFDADDAVGVW